MKTLLKIFLLCIIILSDVSILKAQPITWQRMYGGPQSEYGRDGIQTFDGGYIIVSLRQNQGGGVLLSKLDQYGNEMWSRIIDSTSVGVSIHQTKDSGYVIAGSGQNSGTVIRTDKLGFVNWKKLYSISNESSTFYKMKVLSSGELIMCGGISFPLKAYFVKTDSIGNVIWQKTFSNLTSFTIAYDITQSNDSYYYTTGATSINGFTKTLMGKIDLDGNFIWFKNYGTEGKGDAQSGSDMICQNNNITFICGQRDIHYSHFGHLTKMDSSGSILFQKQYNSASQFVSMDKFSNGFALCGLTRNANTTNLVTVDEYGNELLNRNYSFNSIDEITYPNSISSTFDNGYFITGFTTYLGSEFDLNIIAIKTDSLGNTMVSINNSNSEVKKDYFLYQNYPNPFNPKTTISYELRNTNLVSLKVFNITGKEIEELVHAKQNSGFYSIEWNAADFPSGIYFYELRSGNFISQKRMLLLK